MEKKWISRFNLSDWLISTRLTLLVGGLLVLVIVSITTLMDQIVKTRFTEELGQNFAVEARSLSGLTEAYFLEKGGQLQVLASTHSVGDAAATHNQSYAGNEADILADIQALDEQWQAASADDPLITAVVANDNNPIGHQLLDFDRVFVDHTELAFTDRYGATLFATKHLSDYYHGDEAWWQAAWNEGQGAVYISPESEFDESTEITGFLVAVPIIVDTGEVVGVLRSTVAADELFGKFAVVKVGQTGHAVLLAGDGIIFDPRANAEAGGSAGLNLDLRQHLITAQGHYMVAINETQRETFFGHSLVGETDAEHNHGLTATEEESSDADHQMDDDHGHEAEADDHGHEAEADDHDHEAEADDQTHGVAATGEGDADGHTHDQAPGESGSHTEDEIRAAMRGLGWAVVVRQEVSEVFAPINEAIQVIWLAGAGGALLAALGTWYLSRNLITRPLFRLNQAAEQIGGGDLSVAIRMDNQDEVGQLSQSFDTMVYQLQAAFERVEDQSRSRVQEMGVSAEVGRQLSTILEVDELLEKMVTTVQDQFNYYHVHVYTLDHGLNRLVMQAGTGTAGAEMKAQGHAIDLQAPTSLVARSARDRQVINIENVREAPDWLPNKLLPETHSEIAVPIVLDNDVVGVLDVQENKVAGFDEGQVNLLVALANQVAVAMRNARLFNDVETELARAKAIQEQYLVQAWQKLDTSQRGHYHYARSQGVDLDEPTMIKIKEKTLTRSGPDIVTVNGHQPDEATSKAIVAPITLQNRPIGAIQLHPTTQDQTWSENDLAVVAAVVDQVAQTAENLRLFEETRERAGRETTIRNITDKLRAAPNLDTLLETAARELGQQLGVRRAALEIGIEAEDSRNDNGSHG